MKLGANSPMFLQKFIKNIPLMVGVNFKLCDVYVLCLNNRQMSFFQFPAI